MRIMIKKSVADEICHQWGFPLVKAVKSRRERFLEIKSELLAHIRKLRKQEEASLKKASWELEKSFVLEKAASKKPREKAENGAIRTWSNGKKYKRIAPGKWVQVFNDDRTRGAQQSLRYIERKIASINDERELMWFVQQNKEKFVDNWGYPLPAVERLSELAHKRNDEIVAGKEAKAKNSFQTIINNIFNGEATKDDKVILSNAQRAAEKKINELEKDPEKKEELNSAWENYYDIVPFSSLLRLKSYNTKNNIERSKALFDLRQDIYEKGRMKEFIDNVQFDDQLEDLFDSYASTEKGAKARHEKSFNELCKKLSSAYYINIQNSNIEKWMKKTVGNQAIVNVKKAKAVCAKKALNAPNTGTSGELELYRQHNKPIIDGCYNATDKVLNMLKEHCKGRERTPLENRDIKKLEKQLNSQFDHKALFEMLLQDRPDLIIKAHKTFSDEEKEAAKENAVAMVNDLYMIRRKSQED